MDQSLRFPARDWRYSAAMRFTQDALLLGPLALEWGRLGAILGVLFFTTRLSRLKAPRLERAGWGALIVGFVVARGSFALQHWAATAQDGLWSVVDVRAGGWEAVPGVVAGLLVLSWQLRRTAVRLLPAAALGLGLLFAPGLTKQAFQSSQIRLEPETTLQRLEPDGRLTPLRWADLPARSLVNLWATWCGPCRQEMPLLSELARAGKPVYLLNDGEPQNIVQSFLERQNMRGTPVLLDAQNARAALSVTGLPTTVEVNAGRVTRRHLGPMNRAELEAWLAELAGR